MVFTTHNLEAKGDQPHHEDSVSDTRNEGNDATPVHDRRHPRHVREATPDDAEEEHVVEADKVMTKLKQAFSGASNNANGQGPGPPDAPANQTTPEGRQQYPEGRDSFEMLADSFIKAHTGARKVQARKADIFRIAQGDPELLREFVIRFQKERMLLLVVPDEWAARAFTKGLNLRSSDASQKLKESLLEFQVMTWTDVHNWYESKIRIENDQIGFPSSAKGREKRCGRGFRSADRFVTDRRTDRSQNNRSLQDKEASSTWDPSYPRLSEYKFNGSVVELVPTMRNIKEAWFPKSMRSDPSQRDPNLWCEYHSTNGHWTRDCRHLREEVATLLKNGHLREFLSDRAKNNYGRNCDNAEPSKAGEDPPLQKINMIFGGNEINGVTFSATKKTKVSITHSKRLREVTEDGITFTEEDADGLLLPHKDALVISLKVLDFKIKRVLVYPGSVANIIQWRVLEQAKLTGSIIPATKLLVGFNFASVTTRGEIMLPSNAEEVMKTALFEVVDGEMGYNIILGKPWLHEMRDVPSTYHQLLKFPTPGGIK
nr:uncharacterized protein LOC104100431 [Nicotiana tomentosiformis]